MIRFTDYLDHILTEQLHPEIRSIVTGRRSPQQNIKPLLVKKIKEVTARGEKTGMEGNMPSGSSRAYIPIEEPHSIMLDGAPAQIKTGMKVAIKAELDKHHQKQFYGGMSLGELQNKAEHGDYYSQSRYHILTKKEDGSYETNTEHGIFPPRIDQDHENHSWSHVGHATNLTMKGFQNITKTPEHPKGISHDAFVSTLERSWDLDHGKRWKQPPHVEAALDDVEKHPLVQKFLQHQREYNFPPNDYRQIKNLGVFNHPDGSQHVVARDHGFSDEVMGAYKEARERKYPRVYEG